MSKQRFGAVGYRFLTAWAALIALTCCSDAVFAQAADQPAAVEADEFDDAPAAKQVDKKEAPAAEKPAEKEKAPAPAADSSDAVQPGVAVAAPAANKNDKAKENLGQRKQGDVGKNEELSFLQSKVTAQMLELEERMFRLSEALKSLEPENASRLLIGLKYAREELIQLQMKEIQTALTAQNFRDAIGEQKQLLAKLQRLEQLLLSPDLDFQLQLERLRLMRDLLKRLDGAIKEEEREKLATDVSVDMEKQLKDVRERMATLKELIVSQTGHVKATEGLVQPADADKAANDANGSTQPTGDDNAEDQAVAALTNAQQKTREQAEKLEKGADKIADAGKKMDQAVSQLKQNQPADALPRQNEALQSLQQALKDLEAEEKKLEQALAEEKFAEMRKDQAGNRKTTEGISEMAVQLGDSGAASRGELIRASGSMSKAESSFGAMNAGDADSAQGEALASLKYAREQLNAEAEKLLNRLRNEIKKRTLEGIIQMLEGQVTIRENTERLGPKVKDGARAVITAVTGLSTSEGKLIAIGEGLTALVEETEFGIALPAALRSITDGMNEVKERLAAVDASEDVIAAERQIEEDLQALLDAMKQLPSQSDGEARKGGGNAGARERQLNRLIAELKMVRMLQIRVHRDTKDVDGKRPADIKDLTTQIKRKIESLQDRQEDVHDVTERIAFERAQELPQQ